MLLSFLLLQGTVSAQTAATDNLKTTHVAHCKIQNKNDATLRFAYYYGCL
ncbi:MAG: hypothetical protein LBF88_10165 [Planctomycetaceae bacterium]|nr:hypothetical protein [Planctomycetaceae bacterium]